MDDADAIASGKAHFMETMGNLPEAIRAFIDYAPGMFPGYLGVRQYIYHETPGGLTLATKELIFVILDVVAGNLDGAKNHCRAALRAGVTVEQLAEAMIQVFLVFGVSAWGQTGYKLMDYAAAVARGEDGAD